MQRYFCAARYKIVPPELSMPSRGDPARSGDEATPERITLRNKIPGYAVAIATRTERSIGQPPNGSSSEGFGMKLDEVRAEKSRTETPPKRW